MIPALETLSRERHQVRHFRCGQDSLDAWIRSTAFKAQDLPTSRTYVLVDDHEPGPKRRVLAYFSLASCSVLLDELPIAQRADLPLHPVPTILLTRLAVDRSQQGKGFGAILVGKAVEKAVAAQAIVASYLIAVDAINDAAVAFYRRFGFDGLDSNPNRLYMPIRLLRDRV